MTIVPQFLDNDNRGACQRKTNNVDSALEHYVGSLDVSAIARHRSTFAGMDALKGKQRRP